MELAEKQHAEAIAAEEVAAEEDDDNVGGGEDDYSDSHRDKKQKT